MFAFSYILVTSLIQSFFFVQEVADDTDGNGESDMALKYGKLSIGNTYVWSITKFYH